MISIVNVRKVRTETSLEQMTGIRFGKEILDYYVIYDFNDNIIAYCDNLEELSKFTNLKKKYLKFHFKDREFLRYVYDNSYRKIYHFI